MNWLKTLFHDHTTVAYAVVVIGIVSAVGHMLGSIKFRGIGLGVAGVLFSGLIYSHFWGKPEKEVLEFAREFGLILFVYTIGVQVGPGFLASLRRNGLKLNLMAAGIVLLGSATTLAIYYLRMPKTDLPYAVGLYSGAVTNTPSLAASQQALKEVKSTLEPAISYAIAYPFGVLGIIIAMGIIRTVCKVNVENEIKLLLGDGSKSNTLNTLNIEVTNKNLDGIAVKDLPTLKESGVVISRVLHDGATFLPRGKTPIYLGDILHVVGPAEAIENFRLAVGITSPIDLKKVPGKLTSKMILVTRPAVLGKSIPELDPLSRFEVTVTRIRRAEMELSVGPEIELQFGDSLMVVGEPEDIQEMAKAYGDSVKQLNHPQIIPIFIGIVLGVIVGMIPFSIPGVPAPVKLGLAGGPLLVAIILSRIGNIGPLVWYMPHNANMMVREIGISLFLACVGLLSGAKFYETLKMYGLSWLLYGAIITIVPILIMGFIARLVFKTNYLTICGLMAGSMTDPPALAFAGAVTKSEAPSVAYATVYPLTMFLRVLSTQAMVLMIMR